MQSALSKIWIHIAMSISYDDNHYTASTSLLRCYSPVWKPLCSYLWAIRPCLTTCNKKRYRKIMVHAFFRSIFKFRFHLFNGISTPYRLFNTKIWSISKCLFTIITIFSVKEKWTNPRKNVLVCAWNAKAKMVAPTLCFKHSRSWILTRLTRLDKDVCKALSL